MNGKKSIIIWSIALILIIAILGVIVFGYYKKSTYKASNPIVTMEIENYGTVKIELYPEYAPETVKNFITLANNEFYNGLKFHRVVKDFMIQGGDSKGDGTGSPTFADLYNSDDENAVYKYSNNKEAKGTDSYTIEGEFVANKHNENTLNLVEGTIAMARADYTSYAPTLATESYNSGGSQFFIMTTNNHTNLDGYYAGFGKVIEGMDVIHSIENVECKAAGSEETQENSNAEVSTPVQDIIIKTVTVDTFGVQYDKPKAIEPFNYMKWFYAQYGLNYTE